MSLSYAERKIGALEARTVQRRSNASIAQYSASDRWNRHNYPAHWSERPIHLGMYAPFGRPQVQSSHHLVHGGQPLRANREFGLMLVPLESRVLEFAPDQSQYATPNIGDIGRFL